MKKQIVEATSSRIESCSAYLCNCPCWRRIQEDKERLSIVIWQKAASWSCHPSWWQMNSSDLDPHLINGSSDPHKSIPKTRSRSVQPFFHSSPECPTHIDHATCSNCSNRPHLCNACDVAAYKLIKPQSIHI